MKLGLIRPVDFNNDGRSELLVPRGYAERVCGLGYENAGGKGQPRYYCVPHPRTGAAVDQSGSYRSLDGNEGAIFVGTGLND